MDCWSILEIPRYSDLKTIKRAYAKLLKIYNPEDDAEGYQRLREAYDEAVKYAKKNSKVEKEQNKVNNFYEDVNKSVENEINKSQLDLNIDSSTEEENKTDKSEADNESYDRKKDTYMDSVDNENSEEENDETERIINRHKKVDSYFDYINSNRDNNNRDEQLKSKFQTQDIYKENQSKKISVEEQINEFVNRLYEIYNDIALRIKPEVWDELLDRDVIWNVNAVQTIKDNVFKFLVNHQYLSAYVWGKLYNNFSWSNNDIKLYEQYPKEVVDEILKNLKEPNKLKYDYLGSMDSKVADNYLIERLKAYEALKNHDYRRAYMHIDNARYLYKGDAELLRMLAEYYYNMRDFDNALKFFKEAFEMNNNDIVSAVHIGSILVFNECFSEAITYLKLYLNNNENDKIRLNYIACCYYYTGDLLNAEESFKRVLSFEENNKIIKKYLKNIQKQLDGKRVKNIKFKLDNLLIDKKDKNKKKVKKIIKSKSKTKRKSYTKVILGFGGAIIMGLIIASTIISYNDKGLFDFLYDAAPYGGNSIFKRVIFASDINDIDYETNMRIYLKNIKPIKYYKVSEKVETRIIFSEAEIDQKGLGDKIESQLYIGEFNKHLVLFSDPNYNSNALDKYGGYEIKGAMTSKDKDTVKKIEDECIKNYSNYDWLTDVFIDASQAEIDRAKRNVELIEQQGDKKIKNVKNAQDFVDSDFSGIYSVHLANIVPLDYYLCKVGEEKPNFYTKKEMDKKNLWDNSWIQAYAGTIDNVNIMFTDADFSKEALDADGGYTVKGSKFYFVGVDAIKLTVEGSSPNANKLEITSEHINN